MAKFTGAEYSDISKPENNEYSQLVDKRIFDNELFKNARKDQKLYIISQLKYAIDSDDIRKIFFSNRVMKTGNFDPDEVEKDFENFMKTAQSAIVFYGTEIDEFRQREAVRKELAEEIIKIIKPFGDYNDLEDHNDLINIIMEDLRAPYYENLFNTYLNSKTEADKNELIKTICADQIRELEELRVYSDSTQKMAELSSNLSRIYQQIPRNINEFLKKKTHKFIFLR